MNVSNKVKYVVLGLVVLAVMIAVLLINWRRYKPTIKYDCVVVVGIDGAGTFFKDTDTPNFDSIFKEGAVTFKM